MPGTRKRFWRAKLEGNRERDRRNRRALRHLGWEVLTIWECQTRPTKVDSLIIRLQRFLEE